MALVRLESSGDFSIIFSKNKVPITKNDLNEFSKSIDENLLSTFGEK